MRKGSLFDMLALIIIAVFLFISYFSAAKIYTGFKTAYLDVYNNTGQIDANQAQVLQDGTDVVNFFLDYGLPLLLFGLGIASLVLAYFVPSNPIFIPIGIIFLIIAAVLSVVASNIIQAFLTNSEISPIANEHTLAVQIGNNFPLIFVLFGALMLIILYGRPSPGGQV